MPQGARQRLPESSLTGHTSALGLPSMSYSAVVKRHNNRPRAQQQTLTACAAAATVDALGDLAHWDFQTRLAAQAALINDLQLATQTTTLLAAGRAAARRFGPAWTFTVDKVDFAVAVWRSMQHGVVLGLASPYEGQVGHAYHLLGGSFPIGDRDLPDFLARRLRAQDDLLEHLQLWDPWSGRIETSSYGAVRARFERAGALVLTVARRYR